ncbi:MAG: beta-N-acetylhexosaminidase [bacterium]
MSPMGEALGQLFLIGFHGTEPDRSLSDLIRSENPAGVILFRRNLIDPEQILRLTDSLQKAAGPSTLFVAIDQEGGRVGRLPHPFTRFPSCRALGRSASARLARTCAEVTARELRAVGINFNFAPVLDVDTNPSNPVIGSRAFSSDPDEVARLGLAVLAGFRREHVLGLVKHFPGHGDTAEDSHLALPTVAHPRARLEKVELAPFRSVFAHPGGPDALMSAHVLYPAMDPEMPATLSPGILTVLLRRKMGFQGIVVTDDLEMHAIADRFGPEEAACRALAAGADQILFCHTPSHLTSCRAAVERALAAGSLAESRVLEALHRVRVLKARALRPSQPGDERSALLKTIGSSEHHAIAESAYRYEQESC